MRKNEPYITVVKNILGYNHIVGKKYLLSTFKEKFPFFDPKSDWFEIEYNHKFNVGDQVKYGKKFYTVVDAKYNTPTVVYTIKSGNNKYTYTDIDEKYLESAKVIYIISFSGNLPIAQEISEETFVNKFKGTAKEMFCTEDKAFAEKMQNMFRNYSMTDIVDTVNNM